MAIKNNGKPAADAKLADATAKVKTALGGATSFAKGNVEAVVESGKILGTGLKQIGEGYVADSQGAVALLSADVKEFAAIKSPTDFFALQTKIFSRNLGSAVDFQAKTAEAVIALARDSAAPLSKRVATAVTVLRTA